MGDGKRAAKALNAYLAGTWPPPADDAAPVPKRAAAEASGGANEASEGAAAVARG
jgi:hypothetical protein